MFGMVLVGGVLVLLMVVMRALLRQATTLPGRHGSGDLMPIVVRIDVELAKRNKASASSPRRSA